MFSYNFIIIEPGHILKKIVVIFLLFISLIEAKEIEPLYALHTSGGFVTDFVLDGDNIYVATDMGSVDIFALGSEQMISQIVQIGDRDRQLTPDRTGFYDLD